MFSIELKPNQMLCVINKEHWGWIERVILLFFLSG